MGYSHRLIFFERQVKGLWKTCSMCDELYDTIIVGAGPAGSYCAYELAKKGQQVVVLEKERFPRYKACGGAITRRAEQLLPFSISSVVERRVHDITFTLDGERSISVEIDRPYAAMVMRERFDHLLMEKAKEAGSLLIQESKVLDVRLEDDGVLVETQDGRALKGTFLVGADGALSTLGRIFGHNQQQAFGFAIEGEILVSSSFLQEMSQGLYIDVGVLPGGYGWIFPKKKHLSVGVGQFKKEALHLKQYFHDFLEKWDLLEEGNLEKSQGSLIPIGGKIEDVVHDRVLFIGDAAGLVDPLSGEGIYYALKSAGMASQVILGQRGASKPSLLEYQRIVRGEFNPEFHWSSRLFHLFYNFTPATYKVLEKNPEILHSLLEMVSGEISHLVFYEHMKGYIPIIKKLVMT